MPSPTVFGLGAGDFYATILENDNMALFHPWMLKCPVGAAWIDARESALEQMAQVEHAAPKVVFLEKRLLENLYGPLKAKGVEIICMDPPGPDWPGVHDFWHLADEASPAEVRADLHAYDSSRHAAVLRFTGGTTGKAKCAMYSLGQPVDLGLQPGPLLRNVSLR
jgi:fatty-acyl-CoA synthase